MLQYLGACMVERYESCHRTYNESTAKFEYNKGCYRPSCTSDERSVETRIILLVKMTDRRNIKFNFIMVLKARLFWYLYYGAADTAIRKITLCEYIFVNIILYYRNKILFLLYCCLYQLITDRLHTF